MGAGGEICGFPLGKPLEKTYTRDFPFRKVFLFIGILPSGAFPALSGIVSLRKNRYTNISLHRKERITLKVEIQEGYPDTKVLIQCSAVTDEIKSLQALLLSTSQKISCTRNYQTHLLDKRDILYIESVDKQCFLYTTDAVYESNLKLYQLEELFDAAGFFRNAKSQIINIAKIKSLCPEFGGRIEVKMENGEVVMISRQYAKLFRERIGLK